ncbi:MAG: hypothetical protein P8X58_15225 [Syntrophobacterales bacterium]
MKQAVAQTEVPIFTLKLEASECRFDSMDEIVSYFQEKIESHKAASYIAVKVRYLPSRSCRAMVT